MPNNYFLFDVKEPDEFAEGAFKYAKNIPLSELENRLNEIPKDKVILIYCATGVRSERAYNLLKKAGYKVHFIDAKIEFENGKVNIIPKE